MAWRVSEEGEKGEREQREPRLTCSVVLVSSHINTTIDCGRAALLDVRHAGHHPLGSQNSWTQEVRREGGWEEKDALFACLIQAFSSFFISFARINE